VTNAEACRLRAFQGNFGMFVRAYAYMLSHGADGLRQVAEDAVLNANYVKARLCDVMSPAFPDGPCMHEALFDDAWLDGTGVTTLDFAKAVIDEVRPDIIYVHSTHDVHQDHRAVHAATLVAARSVGRVLCYQSPSATIDFRPPTFLPPEGSPEAQPSWRGAAGGIFPRSPRGAGGGTPRVATQGFRW